MRILVPVNSPQEMESLNPDEYGTEFFCGYMPSWWSDLYNTSHAMNRGIIPAPINNRNGKAANVTREEQLSEMVATAERYGTNLFLAINAKHYPGFLYPSIERYIDEASRLGIRKVIACDEGLIHFLSETHPEIEVSVSCLNQVTNSWAAERYRLLGNVERVVFPRHMNSQEMRLIASSVPKMEFEFFIFSNKCPFDDGHCRGVHDFTPICKDHLVPRFSCEDERRAKQAIDNFIEYSAIVQDYEARGFKCPNFSCAACLLPELGKLDNVVSVKIAFRGHEIAKRLWQVQLARDLISVGDDLEAIRNLVSSVYGDNGLCETGMACMS